MTVPKHNSIAIFSILSPRRVCDFFHSTWLLERPDNVNFFANKLLTLQLIVFYLLVWVVVSREQPKILVADFDCQSLELSLVTTNITLHKDPGKYPQIPVPHPDRN